MSVHTAPRVIKVGKMFGYPCKPTNSLVAGCISAIWLSRIVVCSILVDVHKVGPIRTRNFYDDLTSRVSSKEGSVVEPLVEHGIRLATRLAAARLTYNKTKTVVGNSSQRIADKVVAALRESNIELSATKAAKDLGVDAGGGRRRVTVTQRKRMQTCVFVCV